MGVSNRQLVKRTNTLDKKKISEQGKKKEENKIQAPTSAVNESDQHLGYLD